MTRSNAPSPGKARDAAAALARLRAEYEVRYAHTVFEVEAAARNRHVVLSGVVLLPSQRDAAVARVGAALAGAVDAGRPVEDQIRVLSDPATEPLAWARPADTHADVLRAPGPETAEAPHIRGEADAERWHLSTQARADDPPLRVLCARGCWRLVQLWDGTLGWAHAAALREAPRPPHLPARRAEPGRSVPCDIPGARLLAAADALLGVPYLLGGATPDPGMDCSGFVQRLFWENAELLLPKHTGDQRRVGVRVPRAEVEPGDLLFFKSRREGFAHVAVALDAGGARLAHASRSQGCVCVQPFDAVKGTYAFLGARRVARFAAPAAEAAASGASGAAAGETAAAVRPIDLNDPASLAGHDVHVVGMAGAEGAAVIRFLAGLGVTTITAHDFSTPDAFEKSFRLSHVGLRPRERSERLREMLGLPVRRCLRDEYLDGIHRAEVVFLPQGWFLYDSNAPLRALRERSGVVFSQMTDLYFRLSPAPIAAVTGTNGKSTTSRLLADLVEAGGLPLLFAGNERRSVQVLDRLADFSRDGVLVLEVSNRQLMDLAPRPHVAVVTNVTPDHVEEHGSFAAYVDAKRKLVGFQQTGDFAVLNRDDEVAWSFAEATRARVVPFGLTDRGGDGAWLQAEGMLVLRLDGEEHAICHRTVLQVPGRHNVANALAAAMAALLCGVAPAAIRATVPRFAGIHLRLERVGEVNGARYVNDVKATTPEAALAAVEAFEEPLVVIVGGGDKGLDYTRLAAALARRARHVLVLDSAGGARIADALGGIVPLTSVPDLESAVARCPSLARPGDVVLLSPGCPGLFSMYMDDARGFGALVRDLAIRRGQTPGP